MSLPDNKSNTWVVMPAYNEQHAIVTVVNSLSSYQYRIVIVDDCSDIPVAKTLDKADVSICRHAVNLGQGAALQTGIDFALSNEARFIVTFDSDGQHQASEIERMLQPLHQGECDITLGSRFARGGKAEHIPVSRYIMLKMAVAFTNATTGLKLTDTHNGFRGMTATAARRLKITQNRMAHGSQILEQIKDLGLRYREVPVSISYTAYSMQKGQKLSNAINILWESFEGKLK